MSVNLSDAIKTPRTFLELTGLWPRPNSSTSFKIRGLMTNLVSILFPLTMIMELPKHRDDYEALFAHLTITLPPTTYLLKLFVFKLKEKTFINLLARLNSKHFTDYPQKYSDGLKKSIKKTVVVAKFYWYFCAVVICMYCLSPVLMKTELPVQFSYYLGNYKFLMYTFQVIGLVNAGSNNSCLDVLAASLMTIVSGQTNVLNRKILNFKRNSDGTAKSEEEELDYLGKCVEHHNEIIEFLNSLEDIFSVIFLIQYLGSGAEICYLGFQLVHVHPMSVRFSQMIFFFVSMMCQLGMYCWFGNEIILEVKANSYTDNKLKPFLKSSATRTACYESQWISCDTKTRKFLLIIMERSKRPLFLTAGKFSILSLASFTSVINTSYSYFALMQRMYKDQSN